MDVVLNRTRTCHRPVVEPLRPSALLVVDSAAWQPNEGAGNPLLDRLDPDDGRRLLALTCQLVWATTWMVEANEVVSPRLGLPALPVIDWPDDDEDPAPRLHWKTVFLTQWAAGRPFVWIDDETTDADRRWVEAHHPAPALLHRVDPYRGLTDADFSVIRRWLTQLGVGPDGAHFNC